MSSVPLLPAHDGAPTHDLDMIRADAVLRKYREQTAPANTLQKHIDCMGHEPMYVMDYHSSLIKEGRAMGFMMFMARDDDAKSHLVDCDDVFVESRVEHDTCFVFQYLKRNLNDIVAHDASILFMHPETTKSEFYRRNFINNDETRYMVYPSDVCPRSAHQGPAHTSKLTQADTILEKYRFRASSASDSFLARKIRKSGIKAAYAFSFRPADVYSAAELGYVSLIRTGNSLDVYDATRLESSRELPSPKTILVYVPRGVRIHEIRESLYDDGIVFTDDAIRALHLVYT